MPKIVAIIEARSGSSRLPGKCFLPLGKDYKSREISAIERVLRRVGKSKMVDSVVIAMPGEDRALFSFLEKLYDGGELRDALDVPLSFFRWEEGEEDDVLGRVIYAAKLCRADYVVSITADCPLVPPEHIDFLATWLPMSGDYYASNCCRRSWPDGFDVQICKASALYDLDKMVVGEHRRNTLANFLRYFPLVRHLGNTFEHFKPIGSWSFTLDEQKDADYLQSCYESTEDLEEMTADALIARLIDGRLPVNPVTNDYPTPNAQIKGIEL